MITKTSVACLILILYMGWYYFKNIHIPLKSTTLFISLYMTVTMNAVYDLITIYTVNHLEQVPESINYIAHVIYLLTIAVFIYLLFLYLRSYLETKIRLTGMQRFLQGVPFGISVLLIMVLPLEYIQGKVTNYSMGAKVYALYVGVIIYNILILYYCIRYWKILDREKRQAIFTAVPVFVITTIINISMPEALATIIGVTVILIGLIMSNENNDKYIDKQTNMFNQYAFDVLISEKTNRENVFLLQ